MQNSLVLGLICVISLVYGRIDTDDVSDLKFSQHLRDLAKHINSRDDVLWVAHDPDMTEQEYQDRKMVIENRIVTMSATSPRHKAFDILDSTHPGFVEEAGLAASIDWSTSPYLRAPEDQGQCGSCWAFSTVHAFNDYMSITSRGKVAPISIQEVLTCCTGEGCGGCNGGYLVASYNYMARYGTPSATCKKYNQYPGRCMSVCDDGRTSENTQSHWFSTGYHSYSSPGMTTIMTALQTAPASGSLIIYEDFMLYKSGVYHHTRGSQQGGHAIEIVGYGGTGSSSYWIVKNSWGPRWGANGFFKIISGTNDCQFESMERGYNTGVGFRKQVVGAKKTFKTQDDQPLPPDEDPAGDSAEPADVTDELVQEAARYAASQMNPIHCSGNVSLAEIISAEIQVVSGMKFFLDFTVSSETCTRGPEEFDAIVYMSPSGEFSLMTPESDDSSSTDDQSANAGGAMDGGVDAIWKTLAGVFIAVAAVALLLAICLGYKLMHAPANIPPSDGTTYRQLEHDL